MLLKGKKYERRQEQQNLLVSAVILRKSRFLWLVVNFYLFFFFFLSPVVSLTEKKKDGTSKGTCHLAKIFGSIGWNTNAMRGSSGKFRNKRTTFGGTPLFPFQPITTEITVPFSQNFVVFLHPHCAITCIFFYPPMRLQVWNDWFETENFRKFQPKILANWQVPLLCKKLLDEASGKTFTVNGKSYNIHKSQINKLGWIQVVAENTCKVQERM